MKQVIYLVADRGGIRRMNKAFPELNRGEIPIKLEVEIDNDAFRTPVIEKKIRIENWRQGVDIGDVELKDLTITEEEAQLIREQRIEKMRQIMEQQGYKVTKAGES